MKTSIIIPTYNRAELLPHAVRSIGKGVEAEIIIIDDCSTDNTKQVLSDLQKEDSRVHFVILPKNRGVNYARNKGVDIATSEWVQFLDSDDEFTSSGAEYVANKLDDIKASIGVVGFMTTREEGDVMELRGYRVGVVWKEYYPTYEDVVLKNNIQGDMHLCIRRSIFQKGIFFSKDSRGFETEFFALLAKRGVKFLYLNKIVDHRYAVSGYHLSDEPFKKWPRSFANAYIRFVHEHNEILRQHPEMLRHYYMRIAKCLLVVGNPRGVWWLIRAYSIGL